MQRIKPADVEWMKSGLIAKLKKDQENWSREGDWSPASFHPKRNVCGEPDMDAERL